jgi:hypothetical protein
VHPLICHDQSCRWGPLAPTLSSNIIQERNKLRQAAGGTAAC